MGRNKETKTTKEKNSHSSLKTSSGKYILEAYSKHNYTSRYKMFKVYNFAPKTSRAYPFFYNIAGPYRNIDKWHQITVLQYAGTKIYIMSQKSRQNTQQVRQVIGNISANSINNFFLLWKTYIPSTVLFTFCWSLKEKVS